MQTTNRRSNASPQNTREILVSNSTSSDATRESMSLCDKKGKWIFDLGGHLQPASRHMLWTHSMYVEMPTCWLSPLTFSQTEGFLPTHDPVT